MGKERAITSYKHTDALPLWRAGVVAGTMVYRKVFSYNEKGDLVKVQDFYDNRLENSFNYELTY
ncbi:hypothetical protein [Pedobacter chitinilyticus]|uniref:Uncharacterized protein n=1 Tax=Pedobacter chitinilyticus TaxID=2233776 RepID=A0A3S3PPL9_9SPHI|nr:hypothetical protein [Pedobacter chitinilyticus]RWU09892.1 hypothetical protein DPV69_00660 [Pedobacter chitinilyticus]